MPYFNFEYTKAVTYTVENVGGGIGQDPATEVANLCLFVCFLFSDGTHYQVANLQVYYAREKKI